MQIAKDATRTQTGEKCSKDQIMASDKEPKKYFLMQNICNNQAHYAFI